MGRPDDAHLMGGFGWGRHGGRRCPLRRSPRGWGQPRGNSLRPARVRPARGRGPPLRAPARRGAGRRPRRPRRARCSRRSRPAGENPYDVQRAAAMHGTLRRHLPHLSDPQQALEDRRVRERAARGQGQPRSTPAGTSRDLGA
jgi:hypothetical protein